MLTFEEFLSEEGRFGTYTNSKGISRVKMPQIAAADVGEFKSFLKDRGVKLVSKRAVVETLKPTQKEFDPDKVDKLADAPDSVLRKLIIVSSDSHILDGHHRYSALLKRNPSAKIDILQTNVDIDELLKLAFKFPKTFKKSITEDLDDWQ